MCVQRLTYLLFTNIISPSTFMIFLFILEKQQVDVLSYMLRTHLHIFDRAYETNEVQFILDGAPFQAKLTECDGVVITVTVTLSGGLLSNVSVCLV